MDTPLNLGNVTGIEVYGGTPGAVSPWLNQGGPLQTGFDAIKTTAKSLGISNGVGGSNPEGIGTASDPSKGSLLNNNYNLWGGSNSVTADLGMGNNPGSWINEYFVRSVVIILGFIFVAAGLAMMGRGDNTVAVLQAARKAGP